jgi:hypothetical protein
VLVLKTLGRVALTAAFGVVVVMGCGDDDKDTGTSLPPRNTSTKDAETNTSSSSGATSSGDPTYDCTNHAPVDSNPQCDQCARAKCCEWITKCDGAPSCKQAQECLAACSSDDLFCIAACGETGGQGGTFLTEFGACLNSSCKSECQSAQPNIDAGGDAPF